MVDTKVTRGIEKHEGKLSVYPSQGSSSQLAHCTILSSLHTIYVSFPMLLPDAAFSGALTLSQLRATLNDHPMLIDQIGGEVDMTPLCAACLGGHLHVVKHLLSCGANPNTPSLRNRTPLYYVVNLQCIASSATRCAIIRELVAGKHGLKADLDLPCDDDTNTALMLAISDLKDPEVIQQLIRCGASTTITFRPRQPSAERLMEHETRKAGFVDGNWMSTSDSLVDRAISFLLMILAFFNYKTQETIIGGLSTGPPRPRNSRIAEPEPADNIEEPLKAETWFTSAAQPNNTQKKLQFAIPDPRTERKVRFWEEVKARASLLQADPSSDLGNPGNIERLLSLTKRHIVILCDDSKSMTLEHRYAYQTELVRRMAGVATRLLPASHARVDLRFVNHNFRHSVSVAQIQNVMRFVKPSAGSSLGTSLREKVLQPLVFDIIAEQTETDTTPQPTSGSKRLRRPLLVCIVTDGAPTTEPIEMVYRQILACKEHMQAHGYHRKSVLFNIIQIGSDPAATRFIDNLRAQDSIQDILHCAQGRIDTQYESVWDDERKVDLWLLDLLAAPLGVPKID